MKFMPLFLLSAVSAIGQLQTGPAATTGQCSPAVPGNNNTFNLTCTGLSPAQQQLLENVPNLLNKLLASQSDNTSEMLSKLDVCIAQGASRHISKEQADALDKAFQQYPKQKIKIQVYTMVKESNDFGEEVVAALRHAGLDPEEMKIMSTSGPMTGFFMRIGNDRKEFAQVVAKALIDSKLAPAAPISAELDEKNADTLELIVGFKP